MKTVFILFACLIVMTSCSFSSDEEKEGLKMDNLEQGVNLLQAGEKEKNVLSEQADRGGNPQGTADVALQYRNEDIDIHFDGKNSAEELISFYEKNKEAVKKIREYNGKNQHATQRYFVDGLDVCMEIVNSDLSSDSGKTSFLQNFGLQKLYDYVKDKKMTLSDYVDGEGKLKEEYQIGGRDDKEDVILALYFAGKIKPEKLASEFSILSKFYEDKEPSNSILLTIISEQINGKAGDEKLCYNRFSQLYNLDNNSGGNTQ